jgi:uncharacterized protein (TIGR00156 family)
MKNFVFKGFYMKNKHLVFLGVLLALINLTVNAQQGGFKGPGPAVLTVAEVKGFSDLSLVTLQGKIERFLGINKRYLFSDDTGSITLLIEDNIWGDLSVDENDVIEITGIIIYAPEIFPASIGVTVRVRTIKKILSTG